MYNMDWGIGYEEVEILLEIEREESAWTIGAMFDRFESCDEWD